MSPVYVAGKHPITRLCEQHDTFTRIHRDKNIFLFLYTTSLVYDIDFLRDLRYFYNKLRSSLLQCLWTPIKCTVRAISIKCTLPSVLCKIKMYITYVGRTDISMCVLDIFTYKLEIFIHVYMNFQIIFQSVAYFVCLLTNVLDIDTLMHIKRAISRILKNLKCFVTFLYIIILVLCYMIIWITCH